MTRAQWNASIEPQGVLTIGNVVTHIRQALTDGDAALVDATRAGVAPTNVQLTARDHLKSSLEVYSAAAGHHHSSLIVSEAVRTRVVSQGDNYYGTTNAP